MRRRQLEKAFTMPLHPTNREIKARVKVEASSEVDVVKPEVEAKASTETIRVTIRRMMVKKVMDKFEPHLTEKPSGYAP